MSESIQAAPPFTRIRLMTPDEVRAENRTGALLGHTEAAAEAPQDGAEPATNEASSADGAQGATPDDGEEAENG